MHSLKSHLLRIARTLSYPIGLGVVMIGLAWFCIGWATAIHMPMELAIACRPGFATFVAGAWLAK